MFPRLLIQILFVNLACARTRPAALRIRPVTQTPFGAQPGGVLCSWPPSAVHLLQRGGTSPAKALEIVLPAFVESKDRAKLVGRLDWLIK